MRDEADGRGEDFVDGGIRISPLSRGVKGCVKLHDSDAKMFDRKSGWKSDQKADQKSDFL